MNRFWPLTIQRSPFSTARVCMPEVSLPIWGSVIAIAASSSPASRGAMCCRFWASVPYRRIEMVPRVSVTERSVSAGWPTAASSSSTMHSATTPRPLPPNASGNSAPVSPASPISLRYARAISRRRRRRSGPASCFALISLTRRWAAAACGRISRWANARASCISWSSAGV